MNEGNNMAVGMERPPSLAPRPTCCCSPDNGIWNWRASELERACKTHVDTWKSQQDLHLLGKWEWGNPKYSKRILPMPAQNGKLNQLDKEALAKLSPNLARQTALHIQPRHEISVDEIVSQSQSEIAVRVLSSATFDWACSWNDQRLQ